MCVCLCACVLEGAQLIKQYKIVICVGGRGLDSEVVLRRVAFFNILNHSFKLVVYVV